MAASTSISFDSFIDSAIHKTLVLYLLGNVVLSLLTNQSLPHQSEEVFLVFV